ncbi:hypothetical protein ABEH28_27020 [Pseudomonas sp. Ps21-P2]|jgi:hypothetical protein|uniref:hypothetical protein n=1 Tax=Pseudomonas sp. Ps21-P2 TaxID=3080331 RepID=UPI003209FCFE
MAIFRSSDFMSLSIVLISLSLLISGLPGITLNLFLIGRLLMLVGILRVVFGRFFTARQAKR